VAEAGVTLPPRAGTDITAQDWDFFYRCYERTYLEHGNAPYLTRDFFDRMAAHMPQHWLMFTAERDGQPIATSLIALDGVTQPVRRTAATGARCSAWTACTSRPATTSRCNGAWTTGTPALKAAPRASTRWPAP
jgi:hypothetical protein